MTAVINESDQIHSFYPNTEGYGRNINTSRNWELAEMNTSILIQTIMRDDTYNTRIVNFLIQEINNICEICQLIETHVFNRFFTALRYYFLPQNQGAVNIMLRNNNPTDDNTRFIQLINDIVPVAQTHYWVTNNDRAGFRGDALSMYQYAKYIYGLIKSYQPTPLITERLFIEVFQQSQFIYLNLIRGQRNDVRLNNTDNHVGITGISNDYLLKTMPDPTFTDIREWVHDGDAGCRLSRRNYYNMNKEQERNNNTFYGSLKCGISGSQQFILFSYLISLRETQQPVTDEIHKQNMISLIILSCLYLIGMGGHNAQESIFGLIGSIILLKTWLTEINREINDNSPNTDFTNFTSVRTFFTTNTQNTAPMLVKILNKIREIAQIAQPGTTDEDVFYQMFVALIRKIRICEPFITYFYNNTIDANISGVFTRDLINPRFDNILTRYRRNPQTIRQQIIDSFLDPLNPLLDQNTTGNSDIVLLFFALDNRRFELDRDASFNNYANIFLRDNIDNRILRTTSEEFNKIDPRMLDDDVDVDVPFAFKRTLRRKSPTRKSPSRRKSPRRKSPTRKSTSRRKSNTRRSPRRI